ncbi:MAG: methyltransferase domain-containing protein [Candidatus Doudnabacteria bacterium]
MIKKNLQYYFWASYRRKILDKLLEKNKHYYQGVVLDIGGRDRGKFKKPKDKVEKWIFADIEKKHNPDIVLDVTDMNRIEAETTDVINAIELFEHVEKIEMGLRECYRALKRNGVMILSIPFLYSIHADPYDFQRWTEEKWKRELKEVGFKIEKFEIMGRYFTVAMDMKKALIKNFPIGIRHFCKLFYPIMDLIVNFDDMNLIKKNPELNKFHGGYFIILRK